MPRTLCRCAQAIWSSPGSPAGPAHTPCCASSGALRFLTCYMPPMRDPDYAFSHPSPADMMPTLFVMLPLIDAMSMILPGILNRSIWRPTACAVYSTPFVFTLITCLKTRVRTPRSDRSRLPFENPPHRIPAMVPRVIFPPPPRLRRLVLPYPQSRPPCPTPSSDP